MVLSTKRKLRECPFCGASEDKLLIERWEMVPYEKLHINGDGYWYQVSCGECFADAAEDISLNKAIDNWNKRKDDSNMESTYNSAKDTRLHKDNVFNVIMLLAIPELFERAEYHDDSKLKPPEKEVYDEFIPKLRTAKYGTPEYEKIRDDMRKAGGDHHNKVNRHHPEYFPNGINGMTLNDFNEMVYDWFAASLRSDTTFIEGLDRNIEKYGIPPMMKNIIINTYNDKFKTFEEFMKTKDMPRMKSILRDYKLIAFEQCKNGLYNEETRDWILSNLWNIADHKEHPEHYQD